VVVDDPVGRREFVRRMGETEINTTSVPTDQASHDKPLDSPTKNSACFSQRARLQEAGSAGLVLGA